MLFAVALLVWLVALYAFVRIAIGWYRVYRAAPAGQGIAAAFELSTFNLPAVEQRLGANATSAIEGYRRHFAIFAGCVAALIVLVVVNIVSGKAA